jgi:glutamyl-tRNA reductase
MSIEMETELKECNPLVDCLCMAGINHRSAPIFLREKAALPKGSGGALAELKSGLGLGEVVALSTCNRTEFYWTAPEPVAPLSLFREILPIDRDDLKKLRPCIYTREGGAVARHLFEVACGLDSMFIGETQILNQLKRAYERSREKGLTGTSLNLLFQKAFEVAKKVHTRTRLASRQASIPSVSLKFTEAIFDNLTDINILVVGTGEIARTTVDTLRKRGAHRISFVTRTAERARVWEERHQGAQVVTLDELGEVLWKADLVISCTMTQEPVITADLIEQALQRRGRRGRPLLLLDLGIPRNIAPEVGRLGQVYLHNIDDLQEVVEKYKSRLKEEVVSARLVIKDALDDYVMDCRGATAGSTICDLRSFAKDVGQKELERTMKKLPRLSPKEQKELETLVHRILGKVLHSPTENLRLASRNGHGEEMIHWARTLFGLDR